MVGANEEDLDLDDGAREDDLELEWLCMVPAVPDRIKGGKSRIEGGEMERLS